MKRAFLLALLIVLPWTTVHQLTSASRPVSHGMCPDGPAALFEATIDGMDYYSFISANKRFVIASSRTESTQHEMLTTGHIEPKGDLVVEQSVPFDPNVHNNPCDAIAAPPKA